MGGNIHLLIVGIGPVVVHNAVGNVVRRIGCAGQRIGFEERSQRDHVLVLQIAQRREFGAFIAHIGKFKHDAVPQLLIEREIVVVGDRLLAVMRVVGGDAAYRAGAREHPGRRVKGRRSSVGSGSRGPGIRPGVVSACNDF